jgi:hypothetical protein
MQNETYKSVTELMKTARGNKAIGQCLCDIVDFQEIIDDTPNADVVPVVRCSQCRKRYTTECALWFSQLDDKQYFCGAIHNDDFYCSYGERKD